jgi:hypothetical protein
LYTLCKFHTLHNGSSIAHRLLEFVTQKISVNDKMNKYNIAICLLVLMLNIDNTNTCAIVIPKVTPALVRIPPPAPIVNGEGQSDD